MMRSISLRELEEEVRGHLSAAVYDFFAGGLIAATLPRWLPGAVARLRAWVFLRINGGDGVPIPGAAVDAAPFKWLYAHPATSARSRGAARSDLFWYWLAPGPELATLRAVVREVLQRFALYSSAPHTRSLPHRGPCLIVPRKRPLHPRLCTAALVFMRFRDGWEDVFRSMLQLCLGTYMAWAARRLRMCERYFAGAADR